MKMVERVQDIATKTSDDNNIPEEFIRLEKDQPILTTFTGPIPEIPVIDLGDPDQENIIRGIADASEKWGFFQIVNHGIPTEVIEKLQKVGKEFFELPQEEKEKYAKVPDSDSVEGYGTKLQKDLDGKKSWVDHLFHNIWPPSMINYKFWPENPPYYREANDEYAKCMRGVVDSVLMYLSLGLGVEGDVLKEAVGGEDMEYLLKINYYPPCPRPDLAIGVPPHTDMSAITVLVPNDVTGLQVFQDERWIDAQYVPNALIVHVGDQIQVLSNGKYKAVLHRACVNKHKTRISWPIFCSPPLEKVLGPLPQLVNEENPAMFKTKRYKDYMYCKLNKLPQ